MNSADTADQMMKMTLEGIEVAAEIGLKAGGTAAKSLAVTLYAILTDNKKIKGKTNLDNMLKSGKELKVFAIHHSDLEKFCTEAKHYGVLYSVLKEKNNTDGIVDIMVRAEDASKISRMVDKFDLATIDTKAIRESVLSQNKDVQPLSDEQHDALIKQFDDTERRIIVRALADLRDKQRMEHKNYDFLDSLIVKVCDAEISNPQKDCITR